MLPEVPEPVDCTLQLMRQIASSVLSHERSGRSMQTTELVNEVWIRLASTKSPVELDDPVLRAALATVMRHVLTDHARRRLSLKRGGHFTRSAGDVHELEATAAADHSSLDRIDVILLDDLLTLLQASFPRVARIIELRFFGGLTVQQVAMLLEVSDFTVESDWRFGRAWLAERLGHNDR